MAYDTTSGDPEEPSGAPSRDVVDVWLSFVPGERIAGKYQLIRMLEKGGMGMVWVAHHLGLDVHVALKLIRPEVETPDAAERLVVEAQAAARLRHPAIVQIIDVGRTEEGQPFLVMELLDGECLADVIEREGRIDVVTALRVMLPLAGALSAMHAKGILHRDIKPDNIFLSRDDAGRWQPKLIDFGLARIDSRARAGRITQRGTVIGTPVYLSPERIRGEEAGAKDDMWALCVSLYVAVTGELPFEGDNVMDVFVALAKGEPRSLASHGVDDPALSEILRRGLGPRAERWSTMAELEHALTGELLRRGATRDIAGSALRATSFFTPAPAKAGALPASPASPPGGPSSNRPAWQVYTTKMVRPPLSGVAKPAALDARPMPAPARAEIEPPSPRLPVSEPVLLRRPLSEPVPPEPRPSSPPADPPPGARLTPAIALGLVTVGVVLGLIAGVILGRQSIAAPAAPPAASAGTR